MYSNTHYFYDESSRLQTDTERRPRIDYPDRYGPFIPEPKVKTLSPGIITAHSIGGPEITDPTHGMTGWRDGVLLIYNDRWGKSGWLELGEYQALKRLQSSFEHRFERERFSPPVIFIPTRPQKRKLRGRKRY